MIFLNFLKVSNKLEFVQYSESNNGMTTKYTFFSKKKYLNCLTNYVQSDHIKSDHDRNIPTVIH